jgi:hypothetical protein
MDRFPEELLYILIFAALLLVQYIAQLFRKHSQGEEGRQEAPAPQEKPAAPEEPLPDIWGRAPAPVPAASAAPPKRPARPEAPAGAALAPPGRRAAAMPLPGRQELRRAIVMMTILGRCRAQEPPQGR